MEDFEDAGLGLWNSKTERSYMDMIECLPKYQMRLFALQLCIAVIELGN
jgi:hypothetical protein